MIQFDLLTPPYLGKMVGMPVVKYLKKKHGTNGLKIEQKFSLKVRWLPTIQIKSSTTELTLVEISETLYPPILATAYASLINEEATRPIRVFQACSLDSYQPDKAREAVRSLKDHGYGLMTVDEAGNVDVVFQAAVLIHHIPQMKFEQSVKGLPADVRSPLARAYDLYRTDAKQGLQHAGQVVEALTHLIGSHAEKSGWLNSYKSNITAAKILDALYSATDKNLVDQRACFGGARQFIKVDRNSSSHPAKSARQARENVASVKEGFENALRVCTELCKAKVALRITKRLSV